MGAAFRPTGGSTLPCFATDKMYIDTLHEVINLRFNLRNRFYQKEKYECP